MQTETIHKQQSIETAFDQRERSSLHSDTLLLQTTKKKDNVIIKYGNFSLCSFRGYRCKMWPDFQEGTLSCSTLTFSLLSFNHFVHKVNEVWYLKNLIIALPRYQISLTSCITWRNGKRLNMSLFKNQETKKNWTKKNWTSQEYDYGLNPGPPDFYSGTPTIWTTRLIDRRGVMLLW